MRSGISLIVGLAASIAFPAHAGVCVGDANGDGITGINDFLQVLADWACVDCPDSDVNDDGIVGINDFLLVLSDWGCLVSSGPVTALSGTVTNVWTAQPIEGATVTVGTIELTTDALGDYFGEFAPGIYDLAFDAEYFNGFADQIVLFPNFPATRDVGLEPVANVIVNVAAPPDTEPGDAVDVMAEVIVLDGSTITGYQWLQTAGAAAQMTGDDTDTVSLTLGSRADYKDELTTILTEPPIGPEQLPPNVPPPPEEFPGGLQNRFQVVAVNPFALEEAGLLGLAVDVTTSSGTYSADAEVHSHLPFQINPGIRNVPFGIPVLLYGKDQVPAYDWSMPVRPATSTATLNDATTRSPDFTPDVPGKYQVTVTDQSGAGAGVITIEIWAGNWRGIITGEDADGRPIADSACTGCHINLGYDKFTPWAQTGHAEIFTDLLNENSHNSSSCFQCHSVGFNPDANNNGLDDAFDYPDFLASGLLGNPNPDNWSTMLADYPYSAQVANVQCENCHGPQWGLLGVNTLAHGPAGPSGDPRVSLAADVCGSCHGEPLRHGRFQQWQLSGHANYELAISEGTNGSCARCHSANGFLTWLPVLLGDEPGDPTANIPITWTADDVHPQTCPTCHDPHANGSTTGIGTNATVRISGNTPPLIAGFTAYGVGRGAICMTCHNSRNGLHNDDVWDDYYGTSEASRAPHHSAQADMIMGENAYLVQTGVRGNHSFVNDACVACHMVQTPPPDDLSYNQSGTNHTFYAGIDVCAQCHGPAVDGVYVQGQVQDTLDILQGMIEDAHLAYIGQQTGMGNIVDFSGTLIADVADIQTLEFGEYHGRQALTLTLTDQSVVGPVSANSIDILDGGMNFIEGYYDSAPPGMLKAGWNYALVSNDGSMGVHNPSYAYAVMVSGIDALDPAAAAALPLPGWVDSGMINAMMP